jgi:hypothetical protein
MCQHHLIRSAIDTVLEDFASVHLHVIFLDPTEKGVYREWGTGKEREKEPVGRSSNERALSSRNPREHARKEQQKPLETQLRLNLLRFDRQSCFLDSVLTALFTDPSYFLKKMWDSRDDEFGKAVRDVRSSVLGLPNAKQTPNCNTFRRFLGGFEKTGQNYRANRQNDPAEFLGYLLDHYAASNTGKLLTQYFEQTENDMLQPYGLMKTDNWSSLVVSFGMDQNALEKGDPSRGSISNLDVVQFENSKHGMHFKAIPDEPLSRRGIRNYMIKEQTRGAVDIRIERRNTEARLSIVRLIISAPYYILHVNRTLLEQQMLPNAMSNIGNANEMVHRVIDVQEEVVLSDQTFRLHAAIITYPGHYTCRFRGPDHIFYDYDDVAKPILTVIGNFTELKRYKSDSYGLDTHASLLFYSPVQENEARIDTLFESDRVRQEQMKIFAIEKRVRNEERLKNEKSLRNARTD